MSDFMETQSAAPKQPMHAVDSRPKPKEGSKETITVRVIGRQFVDGHLRIMFDKGEAQGVKACDKGMFSGRDGVIRFTIKGSDQNSWADLDEKNLDAVKHFTVASIEIGG